MFASLREIRRCVEKLGFKAIRVLPGTNYPMIMPGAALKGLDELGLKADVCNALLHGNAQKVLSL